MQEAAKWVSTIARTDLTESERLQVEEVQAEAALAAGTLREAGRAFRRLVEANPWSFTVMLGGPGPSWHKPSDFAAAAIRGTERCGGCDSGTGGGRMPESITLCAISRNEEENLPRLLESVKEVVAEIVLVDTGSTDGTQDLARRYGARVIEHRWQDSFALARNAGLAEVRTPWVLVLDADEALHPGDQAALAGALVRAPVTAAASHPLWQ